MVAVQQFSFFIGEYGAVGIAIEGDTKVGPGLKGLYKKSQLPVSGWDVSDDNIRRQIRTPFANMPPFPGQSEEEIQAVIEYLRSL